MDAVLLAVAALDDGEVVLGEPAGEVGPEHGGDAVGKEDEADLQVREAEAGLEDGGRAGRHHAPDGVDDGSGSEDGEHVFLEEESEGREDHGQRELLPRREVSLDEVLR